MGEGNSSGKKEAIRAAATGESKVLRALLARDGDLVGDPRLLNEAALHGQVAIAKLLLSAGADPDGQVTSHEFYRPLHRAIEHRGAAKNPGHFAVAELLIEAGASLDLRATWMQLTPLAVAGMTGDVESIGFLRDRGADVDIFTAAIIADADRVRGFLRRRDAAMSKDVNSMTVLHYAALSGLAETETCENLRQIARMLLAAGADGDARESIGPYRPTPPLHFAAWKNSSVAAVLLEHGCDPNGGFANCLWREPGAMAELFFSHGADVNAREPSGQPLLNSRVRWNLRSVALWMLERGADPNQTDAHGNTALHEAAARGSHPELVRALLDHGARPESKNASGETALDLATAKKREKIVGLLTMALRAGRPVR